MSARFLFVFVLAAFTLGCCTEAPVEEPAVDVAAEEQAIREASATWLAAAQARDGATIDSFLAADAATIYDGSYREGLAAIQAAREEEWAATPDGVIDWTTTEVGLAASGDLAYERGHWTFDPDGVGETAEEHGQYLTVWKKMDGQWKVMYDAGTTIKAEEEAPPEG
jgi:uncharacterized protein (TIGR02246 family)